MDKTNELYGLSKIPIREFHLIAMKAKDEEITKLKIKIGSLQSYIDELKYDIKKYEAPHKPKFKNSRLYQDFLYEIKTLKAKNRKLMIEKERMQHHILQLHLGISRLETKLKEYESTKIDE